MLGIIVPKYASTILLIVLIVSGLASISTIHSGSAQTSTPVNGIITQDTTWTKTNSPYSLTGPVGVREGVTLTIEPGTTVNLNQYSMVVNGTLTAKGTSNDKIQINGIDGSPPGIPLGSSLAISVTYGITGYGVGIFENVVINSVRVAITGTINNCTINGYVSVGQSSIISNSHVTGLIFAGGNSQVFSNVISGGIQVEYDSPIISNNVISGDGIGSGIWSYLSENVVISGNTITGCNQGIFAQGGNGIINENYIAFNTNGITINYGATVIVQKNTIEKNQAGLQVTSDASPTIRNNNLQNNSYNIYLSTSSNINAADNWWGTTNETAISQTIHDNKNDFNLGTVTFIPFLTLPNSEAPTMPIPSPAPTPNASSSPSQEPTTTPNQSGYNETLFGFDAAEIAIIALLSIIALLLVTLIIFRKKKGKNTV